MAMIGPLSTAGSQFLLSILLMHSMDASAFGRFSFLLILTQLSWGVWSALFCAPLSSLVMNGSSKERSRAERQLASASLLGSGGAILLFMAVCLALRIDWPTAFAFSAYAGIALLRWYGRAQAYVEGRQWSVTRSDLAYALVVLAAPVGIGMFPDAALLITSLTLLTAVTAGLIILQPRTFVGDLRQFTLGHARAYSAIWHSHGRWALLGVVTTEATANGHAYLVTLLRDPSQFAPIAVSSLLIRPLTIGCNALSEYERPRLARRIADKDLDGTRKGVLSFRLMLMAIWLATATAAAMLMIFAPHLVFPAKYETQLIATGGILWMVVGMVRLLRTPDSVMLQAAGAFRTLAMASILSAVVSLLTVTVLILVSGSLWSIGGILLGELIFALSIWKRSQRWANDMERKLCPA